MRIAAGSSPAGRRGRRAAAARDDHRRLGSRALAVQVVADRAVVDDEQRPRVVGVRRVGVVGEPRVEHLADARDRRLPGPDRAARRRRLHRRIVQDRRGAGRLRSRHGCTGCALVAFSFVELGHARARTTSCCGRRARSSGSGERSARRRDVARDRGDGARGRRRARCAAITTVPEIGFAMKVGRLRLPPVPRLPDRRRTGPRARAPSPDRSACSRRPPSRSSTRRPGSSRSARSRPSGRPVSRRWPAAPWSRSR